MEFSGMLTLTRKVEAAYAVSADILAQKFGISKRAFDIIMFLYNNPERYTAKDICNIRNIKANVVSLHVEKLCSEGFLKREHVESDRRKIKLVCTDKALQIAKEGKLMQIGFLNELLEGLTKEDRQQVLKYLAIMEENADRIREKRV